MEYYQAQYYNEALQHYGVKGMKWGVRRKRAANYLKESGKLIYNKVRHPIRSGIATNELDRGARLKTVARRKLLNSGKELANMNQNIKQQNIDMRNKRIARKKGLEPKQKRRKVRPVTYAGERVKLTANRVIHPIRTGVASATGRKNNRMKTLLRKKVALSSYDMESINKDVKKQNIAMKKQRRQKIANKRRAKAAKKLSRKERRKTMRALRANTILHPVKAQNAMIETQKNASLKTTARQQYRGYNTQEAKAITKHIRKQVVEEANAAAKAARKPRKRKRR